MVITIAIVRDSRDFTGIIRNCAEPRWICISSSLFPDQCAGQTTHPSYRLDWASGELNLLLFKDVGHFPPHLAHNSVHRPEVEIGGTLADFSTVIGPFFDRVAEVEPNEDARVRILGSCLGEAGIGAEHW